MTEDANAGGAATAGGVDFQALVGAWMAVRALAEEAVSPLWGLPANVVLTALRAEVTAPVDDLMLTTSADGHVYIQAKTGVQLSDLPTSVLGSAIDQFVRLYLASLTSRPMDPARDRIVLATAHLPGTIENLSAVLTRIRELGTPDRPEECVTNEGETLALAKAMTLVRHFWKAEKNVEPTWLEMRPLLQLIWISLFQLEADGSHEQVAKILLRTAILHEATHAEAAWSVLRVNAIKLAKTRSGVTRAELQKTLISNQLHLRSMRSYDADTAELKAHTKRSLRSLARFSRISYDGHNVTIRRSYEDLLRAEADKASLLLIGDAGCGKSGLLSVTAEALVAAGRDVLVLNAGELGSNSMGTLRNELGLKHDLIDVLEQWHGSEPAFLIIDALDSARDEQRQAMLRRLIEQTQDLRGRWRVVATIRKFDLRHGRNWQQIMPGNGIRPHYDQSFDDVRHMNVEKLSTDELDSIKDEAPDLHKMIVEAPPAVAELARVPFNLMLANEIRSAGAATDLATVTTQLQLLDLYWVRRLGSYAERGRREAVITTITDSMVKARVLHVPASAVGDTGSLAEVLTEGVLLESAGTVQFSHHILFDYAVERLLLRPDTTVTIRRLEEDRDLAISVGPSLKFWLEGHWEREPARTDFWQTSRQLVASTAPSIAKIVSGTVAAAKTVSPSDAKPLLAEIRTEPGARLFGFTADAITADAARIALRVPAPWFEILADVATHGSAFLAHRASYVLHALLDVRAATAEELVHAGRAARRMLVVAWEASPRFRPAVVSALRATCRTFRSNVADSAALLANALDPEHVKSFGHEELQWLAREVSQLAAAPELLLDLYDKTFAASGSADQTTVMSNSQIIGFTSNAKQDIEAAQWELGRQFPAVAQNNPELGLRIALRVAKQYSRRQNTEADRAPVTFGLLGRQAQFVPDPYGAFGRSHDEEPKIVDAAVTQLAAVVTAEPARAEEMLRLIAEENTTALVLRSLIENATTSRPLFDLLRPLLFEGAILRNFTKPLARWITSYKETLSAQDRGRLQTAVMDLRDGSLGDVAAVRLLRVIGPDHLLEDAKNWLADQDKAVKEQLASIPEAPSGDDLDDEVELLVARGMRAEDVRNPTNILVRTRTKALESKSSELTKDATSDQLDTIDKEIRTIKASLDRDSVHPTQVSSSWGAIAEAATKMAILGRDSIADVLLEAATRPEPVFDEEHEEQFARGPSWGGGQARIEAVRGLLALASRSDTEAVVDAIRALAADPVAAVRYHVAQDADWLAKRHPRLFWELVEALIEDKNDGVVRGLFRGTIRHALVQDRQRGIALLIRAHTAAISGRPYPMHVALLEDLQRARGILTARPVELEELRAARPLWEWHVKFEKDAQLKAEAQALEELYRANDVAGEFEKLLAWSTDHDLVVQREADKAAELATAGSAAIDSFLESGLRFLGGEQEIRRLLGVAFQLGRLHHGMEAIQSFARSALGENTLTPRLTFGVEVLAGWLFTVRKGEPDRAVGLIQEWLGNADNDRNRVALLSRIFQGYSPRADWCSPAEEVFLRSQAHLFSTSGQGVTFIACVAPSFETQVIEYKTAIESMLDRLPPDQLTHGLITLIERADTEMMGAKSSGGHIRDVTRWLFDQVLRVANLDDLGGNTKWHLDQLVERGGRADARWLLEALRRRKAIEEADSDSRLGGVGHSVNLGDYVEPLKPGQEHDEDMIRVVGELLDLANDTGSIGYKLPDILHELDPDGVIVPAALAVRAQNAHGYDHLWRVARLAETYVVGTAEWRTIAIAVIAATTQTTDRERRSVFHQLGDPSPTSWSGTPGEVPPAFVSAVTHAKALRDKESDERLRPYWDWYVAMAEEALRNEEEGVKEERGE